MTDMVVEAERVSRRDERGRQEEEGRDPRPPGPRCT